jgi:hypothetical protein
MEHPGVIMTSGADAVWIEVLPDHDYPILTEQEIATAMKWTRATIPPTTGTQLLLRYDQQMG